jgi:hypothetical protein
LRVARQQFHPTVLERATRAAGGASLLFGDAMAERADLRFQ